MTGKDLCELVKRKTASLAAAVIAACALAAAMFVVYEAVLFFMPGVAGPWREWAARVLENPEGFRDWLHVKGAAAPWFFVGAQILQVIFAPVPGQAVALAGGFVFGFWKGWALTTAGLALGSAAAMALSRLLGEKFVRRFVPRGVMSRFDSLLTNGGCTSFFMIFLLPALPDDAVCFIAGLTRLKLMPLMLVCLLGRAPGMAVLSLVGAQLHSGLTLGVKILFGALMLLSVPVWLFWEIIEEKLRVLALGGKK